jgi:hypothetical protein
VNGGMTRCDVIMIPFLAHTHTLQNFPGVLPNKPFSKTFDQGLSLFLPFPSLGHFSLVTIVTTSLTIPLFNQPRAFLDVEIGINVGDIVTLDGFQVFEP